MSDRPQGIVYHGSKGEEVHRIRLTHDQVQEVNEKLGTNANEIVVRFEQVEMRLNTGVEAKAAMASVLCL